MTYLLIALAEISIDSGLVSLITGSGGALVVLMMWVRSLSATNKRLEEENRSISRQSVECITKILERQDQEKSVKFADRVADEAWKKETTELIRKIHSFLQAEQGE